MLDSVRIWLRWITSPAVAVLLLAGCGSGSDSGSTRIPASSSDGANRPASVDQPVHTPVTVLGVASCDVLPQEPTSADASADRLPALRLPCLTPGPDVDLSTLRGQPVLVNLWATWCEPCREEMPLLQSNYLRYGAGVQFVGVNTMDDTPAAGEFLLEVGVTYPQVVDADGAVLNHVRVPGLPVSLAIDAEGRIAGKHIGELTQESIDELIADASR